VCGWPAPRDDGVSVTGSLSQQRARGAAVPERRHGCFEGGAQLAGMSEEIWMTGFKRQKTKKVEVLGIIAVMRLSGISTGETARASPKIV
jgi:hypothetical protein